ncbi:hypothetical protein LCGC14_1008950 [marine sediment metagenome]|uniref:Uncharacterized protein n=1 Tax=marine sediment metagenome TaxID=412755 RepID=A0A0F9NMB2_9ZZZZ
MFVTLDAARQVKNKTGLSVNIVPYSDNTEGIMGGDSSNPKWDEYIRQYKRKYKPYIRLIRKYIIENKLIGITGDQQNEWAFEFSDGANLGFSWRAWGDLMQAIVNKREGYMTYYM